MIPTQVQVNPLRGANQGCSNSTTWNINIYRLCVFRVQTMSN